MQNKKEEIKTNQILLENRQLFLFDIVSDTSAKKLITEMMTLNLINNKSITLYINSPGGSVSDGFSVIDTMNKIKSPITTVIMGEACSMAGVISIAGNKRLMTYHSVWMAHDMTSGSWDYVTKMFDRTDYLKDLQNKLFRFIKEHTKLSKIELQKAKYGELWFASKECLRKGVIDKIIR